MGRKSDMGKGIRALLSNIEQSNTKEEKEELVKELNASMVEIDIEDIETNPFQPRTEFDQVALEELSQSIKVHGLIQAITVRSLGGDKYQLISGERRLRASKMAGLKTVPAYIRVTDDQGMLEMALIENIQRSNLNAIEIGVSYQRLLDECNLTHAELSDRMGKNRSTITNYTRLLKLPPKIQDALRNELISMGHARALAGVSDPVLQLEIFQVCADKSLSVRALEELIKSYNPDKERIIKPTSGGVNKAYTAELKKLQSELSDRLGTNVKINRVANGSGSIKIDFNSDSDFNDILDQLRQIK